MWVGLEEPESLVSIIEVVCTVKLSVEEGNREAIGVGKQTSQVPTAQD
jgi:hypothetical protein